MKGIKGKVALVTGGNSGIGKAAALCFAEEGARVVICARREKECAETTAEINEKGGEAMWVKTDVSHPEDVEHAVKQTVETYGRLDFAFNNAGIPGGIGLLHEFPDDLFHLTIDVNLKGMWYCMKHEILQMLKQESGGVIVNNSSLAGVLGLPVGIAAYAASKHGVVGLTRSAALEYAKHHIRVNAILPGTVRTPMMANATPEMLEYVAASVPMGRIGTPVEAGEAAVWLCSDAASYMTGHSLIIDGGVSAQ